MAIYAVRKDGDTDERLMKRFKKAFQKARILNAVRERRYWKRAAKKRIIRTKAIKRAEYRAEARRKQFYA